MYSYGHLHMAEQKQGDQLEPTYSSSVRKWGVALRTCRKQWMIGRGDERGSGISVLTTRQDDDDRSIWPIDGTLTGTTTPGQSGSGSNYNGVELLFCSIFMLQKQIHIDIMLWDHVESIDKQRNLHQLPKRDKDFNLWQRKWQPQISFLPHPKRATCHPTALFNFLYLKLELDLQLSD